MKTWKVFERNVAKMIIATFSEYGITAKDCYRTPMSGGHRQACKTDPGDVVMSPKLRKLFPMSVECKAYRKINLEELLIPYGQWMKSWRWPKWFAQAERGCLNGRLCPLLVFKADGGQTLVAFPLGRIYHMSFRGVPKIQFEYEGETWLVVRFKAFLIRVKQGLDNR